jgi:hypothetical protein
MYITEEERRRHAYGGSTVPPPPTQNGGVGVTKHALVATPAATVPPPPVTVPAPAASSPGAAIPSAPVAATPVAATPGSAGATGADWNTAAGQGGAPTTAQTPTPFVGTTFMGSTPPFTTHEAPGQGPNEYYHLDANGQLVSASTYGAWVKAEEVKATAAAAAAAATPADAGTLPAPPTRTTVAPPVIAPITTTAGIRGESGWTDVQREAAAAFRATLAGTTPSLAMLQQQEGFDRSSAEQLSMAAGARGRSVAAGNRIAAANIAQIHQQAAAEGAKLRASEVATATTGLGDIATEARGQDIVVETSDADIRLRADIASDDRAYGSSVENAKNALTATGLDDKYVTDWLGGWLILRGQNQTEKMAIMERDLRVWLQENPVAKDFWDKLGAVAGLAGGLGQAASGAAQAGLIGPKKAA